MMLILMFTWDDQIRLQGEQVSCFPYCELIAPIDSCVAILETPLKLLDYHTWQRCVVEYCHLHLVTDNKPKTYRHYLYACVCVWQLEKIGEWGNSNISALDNFTSIPLMLGYLICPSSWQLQITYSSKNYHFFSPLHQMHHRFHEMLPLRWG